MTRKIYRTAQGKTVDLGALELQNEGIRAVGNMNVNARGDVIDSNNNPIDTRNQQVSRQYRRQTSNVRDESVNASPTVSPTVSPKAVSKSAEPAPTTENEESLIGLAAAIARARKIQQEPVQTAAQLAQNTEGVSKI
jgi:hypothetical protein